MLSKLSIHRKIFDDALTINELVHPVPLTPSPKHPPGVGSGTPHEKGTVKWEAPVTWVAATPSMPGSTGASGSGPGFDFLFCGPSVLALSGVARKGRETKKRGGG